MGKRLIRKRHPEAEFLDIIGSKILRRIFLLAMHICTVTSTMDFIPPPPPNKSGFKLVFDVNIVYGNLSLRTLKSMSRNLNKIVLS
jgi:hypothetical protein